MTFCWGRNTNLYQKTAGNLEQKKSCCCAHTQISSRNSQSLCSNFNTATSLVMEKLESNTTYKQVLTLNLDSERKNWHMQEKSPAHPLQWPGRWMWVRRCWAEPQEDGADAHPQNSLWVFLAGGFCSTGVSVCSCPSHSPAWLLGRDGREELPAQCWGDIPARAGAEDTSSAHPPHTRSESTLQECNYRKDWRALASFLCFIPCPRKDEENISVLGI